MGKCVVSRVMPVFMGAAALCGLCGCENPWFGWQACLGGVSKEGHALIQTSDQGFFVAGHEEGAAATVAHMAKLGGDGSVQWERSQAGLGNAFFRDALQLIGAYTLAGGVYDSEDAARHFLLVRTNVTGDVQWSKTYNVGDGKPGSEYGQCSAEALCLTLDGEYVLAGTAERGDAVEGMVVKTDFSGVELWKKTYGSEAGDVGFLDMCGTADGGMMAVGYLVDRATGGSAAAAYRLDGSGNVLWTRSYHLDASRPSSDVAYAVCETEDGGFLFGGRTGEDARSMGLLVRVSAAGDVAWAYAQNPGDMLEVRDVALWPRGGFVVAGSCIATNGQGDFSVMGVEHGGGVLWQRNYGTDDDDVTAAAANAVCATVDGGVAAAGWGQTPLVKRVEVLKLDWDEEDGLF